MPLRKSWQLAFYHNLLTYCSSVVQFMEIVKHFCEFEMTYILKYIIYFNFFVLIS